MKAFVTLAFVAAALLHLVPAVGVLGAAPLQSLYGLPLTDPALLVLMRHRAAVFGMLGLLLLAAAWRPAWRPLAGAVGLASMLSFVALAWPMVDQDAAIARVFWADVAGSVLLAVAMLRRSS